MYESRRHPLATRRRFLRRVTLHVAAIAGLIFGSLLLGMAGYSYFEQLDWRSAFLNAAMLLGGMGPVDAPRTPGGKVFAGLFALYAGLVFLITAGLMFAPLLHRLMHKFHWSEREPS